MKFLCSVCLFVMLSMCGGSWNVNDRTWLRSSHHASRVIGSGRDTGLAQMSPTVQYFRQPIANIHSGRVGPCTGLGQLGPTQNLRTGNNRRYIFGTVSTNFTPRSNSGERLRVNGRIPSTPTGSYQGQFRQDPLLEVPRRNAHDQRPLHNVPQHRQVYTENVLSRPWNHGLRLNGPRTTEVVESRRPCLTILQVNCKYPNMHLLRGSNARYLGPSTASRRLNSTTGTFYNKGSPVFHWVGLDAQRQNTTGMFLFIQVIFANDLNVLFNSEVYK